MPSRRTIITWTAIILITWWAINHPVQAAAIFHNITTRVTSLFDKVNSDMSS